MEPTRVTVFLSSTWLDLQPERRAVEGVLKNFCETKFSGMEYFGSRPEPTVNTSLLEVDRAELYVAIIGSRYGSGITEQEYRRARERGLDCLVYLSRDVMSEPQAQRFRSELRQA